MSANWERHYRDFEDFINDHIFPPHPLEGEGTQLVEFYNGDSKNPPHAVIECFDQRNAKTWAIVLSDWGAWVEVNGTELYVEPYA
jgi:hypothetical protein